MTLPRFLHSISPRLLAVALAVGAAGAVSGMAIGSHRPVDRGLGLDQLPERHFAVGDDARSPIEKRPPDHYPLVMRDRTIPVSDLVLHGRLRNERVAWWRARSDVAAPDYDYPGRIDDAEIERLARWSPPANGSPTGPIGSVRVHTPDGARIEPVPVAVGAAPQAARGRAQPAPRAPSAATQPVPPLFTSTPGEAVANARPAVDSAS